MSKLPLIKKYNKKKNYMECPKCKNKGEVFTDGSMTLKLPAGFGFLPGDAKFSVAVITYKGWIGECSNCRKEVFNWVSRKGGNEYPKSINKKLDKARK